MAYIGNPAAPTLAQVSDNTITSAKIVDGAVTPSDLSTGHPNWDSSGNVGIGTASPSTKLHVAGTGTQGITVERTDASTPGLFQLLSGNSINVLGSSTAKPVAVEINGAEKIRILDSGGITFNGDTAAANALDDYEEGTWTPTIVGSTTAGTASYGAAVGRYTKIGNRVFIQCYVDWSSGTGTGNLRIGGLPFSAENVSNLFSPLSYYTSDVVFAANSFPMPFIRHGNNYVEINQNAVGGSGASSVSYDSAGGFMVGGSYIV